MLELLGQRDDELGVLYAKEDELQQELQDAKAELATLMERLDRLGPERVKAETNARVATSTNAARMLETRRLCSWCSPHSKSVLYLLWH